MQDISLRLKNGFSSPDFDSQTRRFYDNCAKMYDFLYPDHLRYSEQLFSYLLPLLRAEGIKRILDASCGVGHDILFLKSNGFQVDGADVSKEMVAEARRRINDQATTTIFEADARHLPDVIGAGTYDMVIFRGNSLSNVLPAEITTIVRQCAYVLRDKGIVCIDFRDGEELFRERKSFEFRGLGIIDGNCYLSYYILKHSPSIMHPYGVRAHAYSIRGGLSMPEHHTLNIRSYYVMRASVIQSLQNRFELLDCLSTHERALPHLTTLIGRKRAIPQ